MNCMGWTSQSIALVARNQIEIPVPCPLPARSASVIVSQSWREYLNPYIVANCCRLNTARQYIMSRRGVLPETVLHEQDKGQREMTLR